MIVREVPLFFIQFLRLAKTTLDLKSAIINAIRERHRRGNDEAAELWDL